jgi:hypothetical protein
MLDLVCWSRQLSLQPWQQCLMSDGQGYSLCTRKGRRHPTAHHNHYLVR